MITEDYVSFETAKLLKEKGFNEPCNAYWFHMIGTEPIFTDDMPRQIYNNKSDTIEIIGCSTLQIAMKWLREVHNLFIMIDCGVGAYIWSIADISNGNVILKVDAIVGSYEQTCEAAIKYCLEHLI